MPGSLSNMHRHRSTDDLRPQDLLSQKRMASGEVGWMVTPRRSVSGMPGQSQTADAFASRSLGRVDT
ncbi:hypothetical protein GCM10011611_03580 [Aliidongia dinghuensis]|uniref:Uncharacterized protein n=1 Tax=Aliidongia dinghuensis TaxID=1867774 RepID=A0A8J2YP34_9PROT|nr:hypothetical protein [Aliidongia dinghuensis]GGF01314.1 hypothetical protein GCM10011611_03580 [Aliidongia dinghuensis]